MGFKVDLRLKTVTMKVAKKSASKRVTCVVLSRTNMGSLAEFQANKANVSNNDFVQTEAAKVDGKKKFELKATSTYHQHYYMTYV